MESTEKKQTKGYPFEKNELRLPPAENKYSNLKQYHQLADEVSMYVYINVI